MAIGLIALVQAGKEPNLADLGVGKSTSPFWPSSFAILRALESIPVLYLH